MKRKKTTTPSIPDETSFSTSSDELDSELRCLKLSFMRDNYQSLAQSALDKKLPYTQYLAELVHGEACLRQDNAVIRRVQGAKFPWIKTLAQFNWGWPKVIDELRVKELFRLEFFKDKANAIFLGTTGVGKTHLSIALGHAACLSGYSVLFTPAIDVINALAMAQTTGRLKAELAKYLKPDLLILDELGYLPIDKTGADLLFQVVSGRYERNSTIITTNRAYKDWAEIFNHDGALTSAALDRILHHSVTIQVEGSSYRLHERRSAGVRSGRNNTDAETTGATTEQDPLLLS